MWRTASGAGRKSESIQVGALCSLHVLLYWLCNDSNYYLTAGVAAAERQFSSSYDPRAPSSSFLTHPPSLRNTQ